jgi:hypothetical protein
MSTNNNQNIQFNSKKTKVISFNEEDNKEETKVINFNEEETKVINFNEEDNKVFFPYRNKRPIKKNNFLEKVFSFKCDVIFYLNSKKFKSDKKYTHSIVTKIHECNDGIFVMDADDIQPSYEIVEKFSAPLYISIPKDKKVYSEKLGILKIQHRVHKNLIHNMAIPIEFRYEKDCDND